MCMDRIRRLEMLRCAADGRSFAAAAKTLELSPSAVSKGIAELEQSLGVTLFNRTTRQLQLTEDGRQVYEQARDILERVDALEEGVSSRRMRVAGTLRVGLSAALNRHVILPRLAMLLNQHPELNIELCMTQDPRAMQLDNIDVLLTVGEPPSSRLVARRLVQGRPGVYASPDYVRRHGEPSQPEQLADHRCLVFRPPWLTLPVDVWRFNKDGIDKAIQISPRVVTGDREGLIVAAMAGVGVIYMACFDPAPVHSGQLRRLLPDWSCDESFHVYAMHRRSAKVAPRVSAFLRFTREAFRAFDPDEITVVHAESPASPARGVPDVRAA